VRRRVLLRTLLFFFFSPAFSVATQQLKESGNRSHIRNLVTSPFFAVLLIPSFIYSFIHKKEEE
jgi:hypothetical protein